MSNHQGVVYTRSWVAELVLDIAGYTKDKPLWRQIIIEPSCGGGSFLKPIVERLSYAAIRDDRFDADNLYSALSSYDLDENSVRKSRMLVVEVLVANGMEPFDAQALSEVWIKHGDYLLADGLKCDYCVGNPPYLRATNINQKSRELYCARFSTMTKGCDLFVAFIQHGLEALNDDGALCFICADRWMQNQYGRNLRGFISHGYHLDKIIRMYDVDAFEENVSAYPSITRIDRGSGNVLYANCNHEFGPQNVKELKEWMTSHKDDYQCATFSATAFEPLGDDSIIPLAAPDRIKLVTSLLRKLPSLEETNVKIGIGLATGRDSVFLTDQEGIVETERMLPAFNMRDWRRGRRERRLWLINPWEKDNSLINLDEWPLTKAYFSRHKAELDQRHIARKDPSAWYRTIDKPNGNLFGEPMLLFPDMAAKAEPIYSDGSKYPCHNCYWIVSKSWDLAVLGGLLMSDIAEAFVDALGVKMRGGTLRFQAQYLRLIHVPWPSEIPEEVQHRLKEAFISGDRIQANSAARAAYQLGEI
ncbi:Eco57I restriction-modification methylase domain-containing protein [Lancefieldella sp. Marseille-Q7238]|uniref:Eco57I restriction-modification methylase domain-containing protein n=1 Tax=Lancefieldella sp. Marseille-Q7238 TaxID=3022127 RepID=UPI0024A7B4D6|nr:Eco57I restriction-modification methylase domain-containing protein [Lancefieldella sp. Marseille-Q7238]